MLLSLSENTLDNRSIESKSFKEADQEEEEDFSTSTKPDKIHVECNINVQPRNHQAIIQQSLVSSLKQSSVVNKVSFRTSKDSRVPIPIFLSYDASLSDHLSPILPPVTDDSEYGYREIVSSVSHTRSKSQIIGDPNNVHSHSTFGLIRSNSTQILFRSSSGSFKINLSFLDHEIPRADYRTSSISHGLVDLTLP